MTARGRLPWAIALAFAAAIALGFAMARGWLQDPALTRSDYVGTIDLSVDDARLYRRVPFEWRVTSAADSFTGQDIAHIRIDPSGERTVICGWLALDKAGTSRRASRWLSRARLLVGELTISAVFIAPVQAAPGNGLSAGCAGLFDHHRPAANAPLSLDGPAVPE